MGILVFMVVIYGGGLIPAVLLGWVVGKFLKGWKKHLVRGLVYGFFLGPTPFFGMTPAVLMIAQLIGSFTGSPATVGWFVGELTTRPWMFLRDLWITHAGPIMVAAIAAILSRYFEPSATERAQGSTGRLTAECPHCKTLLEFPDQASGVLECSCPQCHQPVRIEME